MQPTQNRTAKNVSRSLYGARLSVIECFETDGGVNIRFDRLI
jgi:hypothetical protein